jgi:serine/threonine protein phosphatase PrpC
VIRYLDETNNPKESLRRAFFTTHDEIKKQNINGGTTALISLFLRDKCYVANLGDSRAVLWQGKEKLTTRVSNDHKPHLPEEEQRVMSQVSLFLFLFQ